MLCKDLRDGMLLEITDDKMCGWFNTLAVVQNSRFPGMPVRFRIASDSVGLLMKAQGISKIFKNRDTIMYLGTKQITASRAKKIRQVRMVYVDGRTGYVEGYDVKFLRPQ